MSKRILVIDDDEGIRKSFNLALEDTGYEVDTAEGGEKGITLEKERKYDLIYLDLNMPGIDGVQTLRKIREIDRDVPVYIITAFHKEFFEPLQLVAKERINFEVMQKPIGMDKIVMTSRGILEGPQVAE
jgi:DNA-binding response OmpR family regulator